MNLSRQLSEIVGKDNVSQKPDDLKYYGLDWTRFYEPDPIAVVFVRDTQQIVELVKWARTERIALVPSGGRTGLSGGACATQGEVVVSFEKLNQIKSFREADNSVVVEAGVVTANLQAFAEDKGLFYPVDFASSGSSHVGGNIATNAGGIRVLRYGMTRNWVSGLKVVTGNGDLLELNKGLAKNNTGYDLRHAFIGSEGTLGLIVEATMQLAPQPKDAAVILLGITRMQDCIEVLTTFRSRVTLNAFEFFSDLALRHVLHSSDLEAPLTSPSPFYVLLEFEKSNELELEEATHAFEQCVAGGLVTDGIVSSSAAQNQQLWQYRERISESITPRTPYKNDVSVTIGKIPDFLSTVDAMVSQQYPEFEIVWFGHIGDGNVHLNILKPQEWETDRFKTECEQASEKVLAIVQEFEGSISAEHGVGLLKKDQLHFTKSAQEIALMRQLKNLFDPDGIMNPGKLL